MIEIKPTIKIYEKLPHKEKGELYEFMNRVIEKGSKSAGYNEKKKAIYKELIEQGKVEISDLPKGKYWGIMSKDYITKEVDGRLLLVNKKDIARKYYKLRKEKNKYRELIKQMFFGKYFPNPFIKLK